MKEMIELNGDITILINCKQAMNKKAQLQRQKAKRHMAAYTWIGRNPTLNILMWGCLCHIFICGACLCRLSSGSEATATQRLNKEWRRRRHLPFVRQTIILWLNFPTGSRLREWVSTIVESCNKVAFYLCQHGKQVVKSSEAS